MLITLYYFLYFSFLWMKFPLLSIQFWEFSVEDTVLIPCTNLSKNIIIRACFSSICSSLRVIFVITVLMSFPFSANQLKLTQIEIHVNMSTKVIGSQGMTLLNLHQEREKKLWRKLLDWWKFQPVNRMELQKSPLVTGWRQQLAQ